LHVVGDLFELHVVGDTVDTVDTLCTTYC